MINKWKKEEETFGADASREKVTCYLGGNSKRGLFFHWEIWAQNDIGGGGIPVFIQGSISGLGGGLYS